LTRSEEQAADSAEKFSNLGAEVISFPTLEIAPPDNWQQFDDIVLSHERIDFLIFNSANAVRMSLKRLEDSEINFDFNSVDIIAVGKKTAEECKRKNIPVKLIPKDFSSRGLLNELSSYDLKEKIIFIPRSAIGRNELPEGLESMGAVVKTAPVYNVTVPAYETVKPYIEKLEGCKPDLFIFTSPSSFENFLSILNISNPVEYFKMLTVAAIGPTTKESIEKRQVKVDIIPSEYSVEGLVTAIINYYRK
ncbi:MAG TPA: uroporphyrinogen-III synthase, partial [Ignavibacteriaceae bacterium]|nr:uroporphyrinogen-III synthase [Ignavibacteriaceae bacterium]